MSRSKSFPFSSDDPMAKSHALISAFVEEAMSDPKYSYYQQTDLKTTPTGAALLVVGPQQAREILLAAVIQTRYWDEQSEHVRLQGKSDHERINAHLLPGWKSVWGRRRIAESVIRTFLRRTLPFENADLLVLLDWCCHAHNLSTDHAPLGLIVKALERHVARNGLDETLDLALRDFVSVLRASRDKEANRLGTKVEQLTVSTPALETSPDGSTRLPAPRPAAAGSLNILTQLKRAMKLLPDSSIAPTIVLEPNRIEIPADSPLIEKHRLIGELLTNVIDTLDYSDPDFNQYEAGRKLLNLAPSERGLALLAAAEGRVNALLDDPPDYTETAVWQSRYGTGSVFAQLFKTNFELDRQGLFDLLLFLSVCHSHERSNFELKLPSLISQVEQCAGQAPLEEGERYVLSLFRNSLISGPPFGSVTQEVQQLTTLIQDQAWFALVPGEAWTDALNADLSSLTTSARAAWICLLKHAVTAVAARPSAKWLATARQLLQAIDPIQVQHLFQRWLSLMASGRSVTKLGSYVGDTRGSNDTIHDENGNCLRGILWCIPLLPHKDQLTRTITSVALSAYKKVPGVGPRAVKVGNAAVYVLSELASQEAVGQLALLKVRIKFGTAQKEIEKAFLSAAAALNLPRDQIEELGVPSYGLEEVGKHCENLGDYRAELSVTGSNAALSWFDAKGKKLKAVPAKIKSEHKEDWKDLQQSLKDILLMLPAQRDRIDSLFLLQKNWPIKEWQERYHDHPLVGTIAQRLIWTVDGKAVVFQGGLPTDVRGNRVEQQPTAIVQLWHPVGKSIEEITAWRRRLEELKITQPFKQAYREIYLLTDAERNTRTYSNRFAAHVIRQHQFNALCAARGWKNKLRLLVDDSYPPASRELPLWGLRAEFWIEGIGDNYGTDTNETGTFLRLSTDQVRFYRSVAATNYAHAGGGGYVSAANGPGQNNLNEPIPLEEIPELVFSEIMRDVDLFVGVASVGNDPTWQDGGPGGRYREYWHNYSFGELSSTASTRKQALEPLVPRLKIAARCSFNDRFLVVRGDLRTYKIHLGSGNILMEPNDQYLCIVPDAKARAAQDDLYLPFEGDAVLSIIISKALLLAEDTKIKDITITRQIQKK